MQKIIPVLIGLAALSFIFAVISVFFEGAVLRISAEAFSRACTNLALIAIAITVWSKKTSA